MYITRYIAHVIYIIWYPRFVCIACPECFILVQNVIEHLPWCQMEARKTITMANTHETVASSGLDNSHDGSEESVTATRNLDICSQRNRDPSGWRTSLTTAPPRDAFCLFPLLQILRCHWAQKGRPALVGRPMLFTAVFRDWRRADRRFSGWVRGTVVVPRCTRMSSGTTGGRRWALFWLIRSLMPLRTAQWAGGRWSAVTGTVLCASPGPSLWPTVTAFRAGQACRAGKREKLFLQWWIRTRLLPRPGLTTLIWPGPGREWRLTETNRDSHTEKHSDSSQL